MQVSISSPAEKADAAGVERAPFLLQFVDDLHGAAPSLRPTRCRRGSRRRARRLSRGRGAIALDIGDNVHHLAVALDEELVGDFDRADIGDAADVVAPEIEEH